MRRTTSETSLTYQGRSQDFQKGGGVDFGLKRAKQGASEASVAVNDKLSNFSLSLLPSL